MKFNPLLLNLFASKKSTGSRIWARRLYVSDSVQPRADKIREDIEKEKRMKDIFVLMLPTNPVNQLDIIDANYLKQNYYRNMPLTIVGLAKGKGEAMDLFMRIMEDCVSAQNNGDLRTFLKKHLEEGGKVVH